MTAKKTTSAKAKAASAPEQSPAASSDPDVQIAARSQDVDERTSSEHRKVYVIPRNPLVTDDYTAEEHQDMHARNIDAMRQSMVLQGLRPTEDGRFVGAEDHPDGQSVCLTYAAACVPAALATREQSQVRITVDDQHQLERQNAGELDDQGREKAKG